jgi:hypothetical protein
MSDPTRAGQSKPTGGRGELDRLCRPFFCFQPIRQVPRQTLDKAARPLFLPGGLLFFPETLGGREKEGYEASVRTPAVIELYFNSRTEISSPAETLAARSSRRGGASGTKLETG